jgi:hypothetical protein
VVEPVGHAEPLVQGQPSLRAMGRSVEVQAKNKTKLAND